MPASLENLQDSPRIQNGDGIRLLQQYIVDLGGDPGVIDGFRGPNTQRGLNSLAETLGIELAPGQNIPMTDDTLNLLLEARNAQQAAARESAAPVVGEPTPLTSAPEEPVATVTVQRDRADNPVEAVWDAVTGADHTVQGGQPEAETPAAEQTQERQIEYRWGTDRSGGPALDAYYEGTNERVDPVTLIGEGVAAGAEAGWEAATAAADAVAEGAEAVADGVEWVADEIASAPPVQHSYPGDAGSRFGRDR